jgi:hypothetical protein
MTCTITPEELAGIWEAVMEKYPKWPKEKTCLTEKRMRDEARMCYKKKLINELERAKTILANLNAGSEED